MADFADDPNIPNDAQLWRRIRADFIRWDPAQGRRRPSSQAFQVHRHSGALSCILASALKGPEEALAAFDGYYLASVLVGALRELGLSVTQHPVQEGEPGHTWVAGPVDKKKSKIAQLSVWVVAPPDVYVQPAE